MGTSLSKRLNLQDDVLLQRRDFWWALAESSAPELDRDLSDIPDDAVDLRQRYYQSVFSFPKNVNRYMRALGFAFLANDGIQNLIAETRQLLGGDAFGMYHVVHTALDQDQDDTIGRIFDGLKEALRTIDSESPRKNPLSDLFHYTLASYMLDPNKQADIQPLRYKATDRLGQFSEFPVGFFGQRLSRFLELFKCLDNLGLQHADQNSKMALTQILVPWDEMVRQAQRNVYIWDSQQLPVDVFHPFISAIFLGLERRYEFSELGEFSAPGSYDEPSLIEAFFQTSGEIIDGLGLYRPRPGPQARYHD